MFLNKRATVMRLTKEKEKRTCRDSKKCDVEITMVNYRI